MPHINDLGKGLLEQPKDPRDFNAAFAGVGASLVDWSKELRLPEPPDHNQGSSDSCVSHATSYLHWQLKRKNYSRRDVFSRIYLSYGAYLRDGVKQVCTTGQQTKDECPDPDPQTMQNMRVKSDKPDSAGMDDLEERYFLADANIEIVAQVVRDYRGCVFGVTGNSAGWVDLTNPRPPVSGEQGEWGHALYAFGYHLHDGLKCIIAKSSWCYPGHKEHHIKEDYFSSGYTFNNWVLIPKGTITMPTRYVVQKGGKLGVLVSVDGDGVFADVVFWAKSEEHFAQLKKQYEVPNDAPRINYPV